MTESDLQAFYEREAVERDQRATDPRRNAARVGFVELLQREGRRTLIEPGCGPGHDGLAFVAAGFDWTGVDLAEAHVELCRSKGLAAVRGSIRSLPFDQYQVDAAWTMSTLVHVSDADLDQVLTELTRVVVPGGPIAIGLWSRGEDSEEIKIDDREAVPDAPPRFFVYRSDETLLRRFGAHGAVQALQTWTGQGPFIYQWFILRSGFRKPDEQMGDLLVG